MSGPRRVPGTRTRVHVAVIALLPLLFLTSCVGSEPQPAPSASGGLRTVDIAELDAESITVRPFGDFLMSSGELVWVSGVEPGIVAYDDSMDPVFEVEAGTVWAALEFGLGYIWSSEAPDDTEATTLLRIDPATGETARFALPSPGVPEESSIAVTDDAVWAIIRPVTAGDDWTLVGLDPASGAAVRAIDVGTDTAAAVRGGFGSLWVTRPSGLLSRIDPTTGETQAEIELPHSSTFLSVGPDAVWVMNQVGEVTRIDPATDTVVATISANRSGIQGGDIVASADAVWVQANSLLGVEIDPDTDEVVQRLGPARGSGSIAITADGAVWITAHDVFTLYRLSPADAR